ncbi:MAG: serine/threonine-protein kinase [Isosphaeraceae bacterium]
MEEGPPGFHGDGAPGDRESTINLAIFDYHAAIDRGESPDPEAWARRHPEIAGELLAYFEDLASLGFLAPSAQEADREATIAWPAAPSPAMPSLREGDILGDYALLEKLGEGGQGVVWKARPRREGAIVVALKVLPSDPSGDSALLDRFRDEVRAIARLGHDHIIRTFYVGEDGGSWFFAMEWMEGGTLADRIRSGPVDRRWAVERLEKIARAIHHAHTRNPGILHLDLKPANILLTADGEPKVSDFGLSTRLPTADPGPEGAGDDGGIPADLARVGIVGTLPYMSPEMAEGAMVGHLDGLRRLRPGGDPVRLAGPPPAVPGPGGDGHPRPGHPGGPGPSPGDRPRHRPRTPGRLPEMLEPRPRRAVRLGRRPRERPPPVARPAADPGRREALGRPGGGLLDPPAPGRPRLAGVAAVLLWVAWLLAASASIREANARRDADRLAVQVDRARLIRGAHPDPGGRPPAEGGLRRVPRAGTGRGRRQRSRSSSRPGSKARTCSGSPRRTRSSTRSSWRRTGSWADTLPGSTSVKEFPGPRLLPIVDRRPAGGPEGRAVSRSYRSIKDGRDKIAVTSRIRGEGGGRLGLLVANFPIGRT